MDPRHHLIIFCISIMIVFTYETFRSQGRTLKQKGSRSHEGS